MKPKVFVGSSLESLDIAYAVQENLEYDAEVTVWTQGIFQLSSTALQDLLSLVGTYDFAVFVFSPDDTVFLRDNQYQTVRDNVIFEFGLFVSQLGIERVFFVMPRDQVFLHLPTDILGFSPATYSTQRSDNNIKAALGTACNQIRNQIKRVGCLVKIAESDIIKERTLSKFVYSLVKYSKFQEIQYNRILSVFAQVFQCGRIPLDDLSVVELSTQITAATLFHLTKDGQALVEIGFYGDVEEHNLYDLTEKNSYVVAAYYNKEMVMAEKKDIVGLENEFIMCTPPIAKDYILTIHFKVTKGMILEEQYKIILQILYERNSHLFNALYTLLERSVHDQEL